MFQNSARFWLILIGLPITYVLGALLWYLITHLYWVISIHFFHISVKHYPDVGIWPTRILMAGLYYFLLFKNINPLIYVYRSFDYKPQAFFGVSKGLRPYLIWALHLIVFWAFAYTLGTVITINLRSIVNIGWGNFIEKSAVITPWLFGWLDDLVPSISHEKFFWDHIFEILVHIINEPMNSLNSQSMFYMMRLVLWSITITLCLSFYCYSVFSILWSRKFIRNIDFTLAGWVTTGICYSPLLAGVLYQITPNVNGVIPNFDVDAWKWMTLICELLLNLLYTLTVFNMGKKFGVLVDKGVIKTGFYAVIRHPSYLLEVMMFIMISIVALSGILQWMAILALIIKYWFRAEREDQFMSGSNPEYLVYKKQVPFKFIPGVY
ncbi:methyltransferase family protein [Marinicellulosiphila megalodicopiae]|uniref:methyltransferase family protein n=1 Tax=Marinicellulosiphila megalodicopiae TaxID=2724896 RepID=UPI003BB1FAAB